MACRIDAPGHQVDSSNTMNISSLFGMNNPRTLAAFLHDIVAAAAAWILAFYLRFNFDVPEYFLQAAFSALFWVLPLFSVLFITFGLYRGLWRFASLDDLQHLVYSAGLGALLTTTLVLLFSVAGIPRSVLLLHPLLLALFMGGSRFAYRSWKEHRLYGPAKLRGQPVFLLGAGEAADSLLREMGRSRQWYAVGLLDDNPSRVGRRLRRLPVLGRLDEVGELAQKYSVRHVIMAMPGAKPAERRRAAELAAEAGLAVLTMPSYDDLLAGRLSVSNIRRVELEDLLGRDPVTLDNAGLHEFLEGCVVLVTGAGGSIGSELCRQIASLNPASLVLLENSEFALYQVVEELTWRFPKLSLAPFVADIRDCSRVSEVLAAVKPRVVFHAAAYKHVPLLERDNAWQGVKVNAFGTLSVARAALACGVEKFVMISTDKAINPTNVMGATKRLAERVCCYFGKKGKTKFLVVRFGNVLGSNGSVIPKFREQIARGGPITITHPDIVRYFMTIPEAAQLVLQAGFIGRGGEIFVLEMGDPVRIVDLAKDMIRLSGVSENEIQISFTGLRPGEKLFEELLADDETTLPTPCQKLRVAKFSDTMSEAEFVRLHDWLSVAVRATPETKAGLLDFVPEYFPEVAN